MEVTGYCLEIDDFHHRRIFPLRCSGILFNHETVRRGETFVTRKITLAAARIGLGLQDCLYQMWLIFGVTP